METMAITKINLCNVEGASEFIELTSKYPEFDINLKQNEMVIDGKSSVGVMALDLSKPIIVTVISCEEESVKDFYERISKWSCDAEQ